MALIRSSSRIKSSTDDNRQQSISPSNYIFKKNMHYRLFIDFQQQSINCYPLISIATDHQFY